MTGGGGFSPIKQSFGEFEPNKAGVGNEIDINREVEKLVLDQLATLKEQQRQHFLTDLQN